jgi:hypothetical protein
MVFRRRPNRFSEDERAAMKAEGGELAGEAGVGPEVTEPTRKITDVPLGTFAGLLNQPIDHETGAILKDKKERKKVDKEDKDVEPTPPPISGEGPVTTQTRTVSADAVRQIVLGPEVAAATEDLDQTMKAIHDVLGTLGQEERS